MLKVHVFIQTALGMTHLLQSVKLAHISTKCCEIIFITIFCNIQLWKPQPKVLEVSESAWVGTSWSEFASVNETDLSLICFHTSLDELTKWQFESNVLQEENALSALISLISFSFSQQCYILVFLFQLTFWTVCLRHFFTDAEGTQTGCTLPVEVNNKTSPCRLIMGRMIPVELFPPHLSWL